MSLQTDYDSFNKYRGDIEQRRGAAEDKFITERNDKRHDLIQSGLKPGSREYNKQMETVNSSYKSDITGINKDMESFNKSAKVKNLQEFYEQSNAFTDTKKEFLTQEDFDNTRPSFNEFVTGEFGTDQQKSAFEVSQDRRITNLRGIQ